MSTKPAPEKPGHANAWQWRWVAFALESTALFAFWLILSGRFEPRYVVTGALAAAGVAAFTHSFLHAPGSGATVRRDLLFALISAGRLAAYIPWLLLAIARANIQVAALVLNPRLPIDPALLQFKTRMRKSASLVTLANSITLTPGTITVDLTAKAYTVHALVRESASDIESASMQNKIARVFGERKEPPPEVSWAYSLEELDSGRAL